MAKWVKSVAPKLKCYECEKTVFTRRGSAYFCFACGAKHARKSAKGSGVIAPAPYMGQFHWIDGEDLVTSQKIKGNKF